MAAVSTPRRNVDQNKDTKCDLGTFVVSVEKFKKLARPIVISFRILASLIRWKYPLVSITVIPMSCLLIIFKPDYLLAMALFSFPLLMLITLVKKLGDKESSSRDYHHLFQRRDESPDLILKRASKMKAQEHLDLYLVILLEIQDLCNNLSGKLELFYGIFSWKKATHTLIFLVVIVAIAISLFCTETKYLISGALLFACICNSGFKQAIKDSCCFLYNLPSKITKATPEPPQDDFGEVTTEEIPSDFDIQMKEQDLFEENEIESSSSSDSEGLVEKQEFKEHQPVDIDEDQNKQRERSGLSFVSKFASSTLASLTRRRRKHGGNCAACTVEFSTILKKRNYCRHCGKSYCSRCCHQRVPKVVFGATAPAAYEERVLVCQSCYSFLMNRIKGTNTEIIE